MEEAVEDMIIGQSFYESQQNGIGQYFWDQIVADVETLFVCAGVHQLHYGLPRLLSERFPYAIYYEVVDEVAYVLAVLPVRRDPAWLRMKAAGRSHDD
ncbi:MAG TPA: hypothetical protein VMH83_15635 [Candidatus Acidoferrum sp.]|nr:hypothetical protein [Candidatus Acidoferrum sp.]